MRLWLSKNESTLYYKQPEPQNKLIAFFRGARTINLSNIKGFIYGPFSSTFQARKPKVLRAMNLDTQALDLKPSVSQTSAIDTVFLGMSQLRLSTRAHRGSISVQDNSPHMK